MRAAEPFAIARLALRNRLVGTAHGRGIVEDWLPLPEDAEYWRRCAAGGAAMVTVGGTVTARESTWRRRITTEAWRPEAVPGMAARAEAIRAEGAVAACQLVHLGRETTGAEQWFPPVAPSAVRSPREPTRARALSDGELDAVVEGFRVSAVNAVEAGFQVVELHAAHGYLLAQFLSPATNPGPLDHRLALLERVVREIRACARQAVVGVRLSVDDTPDVLPRAGALADYVDVTVGQRTTYVRDMATEVPPLLADVARLREQVDAPLLVSQAFRTPAAVEAALAAGADLVGMARALIADPDMPRKLLAGRAAQIRPCVACNEDCRAFDPVLLCSVNPQLGPPGEPRRPAAPLVVRRAGDRSARRVAIVGAGPAGLECALTLAGRRDVVLFDAAASIGGALATAAAAPTRGGWRALLDFYAAALDQVELRLGAPVSGEELAVFEEIVLAIGATEVLPTLPGIERALPASEIRELRGRDLLVVDDGFGWWPCAGAIERGIRSGFETITVATPGPAFAAALASEARVQLLARLRGAPLTVRPFTALEALDDDGALLANTLSGRRERVHADAVVVVGERVARDWRALVPHTGGVRVIGDALVPRKVAHAIAEGRAAGEAIARARPRAGLLMETT